VRRAHVRAGESHFNKQKSNACVVAGDAEIGSECDACTGAGSGAVETCNHRFRQSANVADELASHARELKQAFHVTAEEFADDVAHVTTGTERTARARDDDDANVALITQRRKLVSQLAIDFKRQRIQTIWTVQRDRGNVVFVLFIKKRRWLLHAGINAIPSISTCASSSKSPATSTMTIAGKCLPMCLRYRSPTSRVRARYSLLFVT